MGSGFQTFTAGSVLTASEVNNYLMEQSVMVFATTAARDSAITAPEAGMTAYINSGDSSEGLYSYTGTTWNKGPSWNAPWGILTSTHVATHVQINAAHQAETVVMSSTAVTIPANRTIKITASYTYFCAVAGVTANQKIRRGTSTAGTQVGFAYSPGLVLANVEAGATMVAIDTTNSGSVQYCMTATYSANNADYTPTTIIVEDIGPSGAPN